MHYNDQIQYVNMYVISTVQLIGLILKHSNNRLEEIYFVGHADFFLAMMLISDL